MQGHEHDRLLSSLQSQSFASLSMTLDVSSTFPSLQLAAADPLSSSSPSITRSPIGEPQDSLSIDANAGLSELPESQRKDLVKALTEASAKIGSIQMNTSLIPTEAFQPTNAAPDASSSSKHQFVLSKLTQDLLTVLTPTPITKTPASIIPVISASKISSSSAPVNPLSFLQSFKQRYTIPNMHTPVSALETPTSASAASAAAVVNSASSKSPSTSKTHSSSTPLSSHTETSSSLAKPSMTPEVKIQLKTPIKSGTSSAVKSNKRPRGTNAKGKIRGDCDDDNDNHDVTSNDKINDEYVGKVSDNDDDDADDKEDSADKDFIAVRKEPIPKKRRVSTALKAADAEWKGTVDTCVKEIESILLAMDNASGGDGSTAMDTSTSSVSKNANAVTAADGQLTYSSLRKFTRAMKFISESGKFDELMEKLDDTDGASENDDEEGEPEKECVGKMRNMLRICFDIVRGSEFYSLGNDFSLTPQSLKRSHQPNPMLVCDDAAGGGDDDEEERGEAGSELTEDNLKTALDRIIHSLEASFGFFLIISGIISWSMKLSGKLSNNKIYNEDNISSCLNLIKTQMQHSLFAINDCLLEQEDRLSANAKQLKASVEKSSSIKQKLASLVSRIGDNFGKIYDLLHRVRLSDDIVIPIAFFALTPFFVEGATNAVNVDMLQTRGMDVLRLIFSRYPSHRNFILEEVLSNMLKTNSATKSRSVRQFRLPDGKYIQMISALILQLLQSCCRTDENNLVRAANEILNQEESVRVNVGDEIQPVADAASSSTAMEQDGDNKEAPTAQQRYQKMNALFKSGNDSAAQCSAFFLKYLHGRGYSTDSTTPKGKKSTNTSSDSEYRVILDHFLSDVLAVLHFPEWPIAEIIVNLYGRMAMNFLDEKKAGDAQVKAHSLEWIGSVCGKIVAVDDNPFNFVQEFQANISISDYIGLWEAHKTMLDWLSIRQEDDPSFENSRWYYLSTWGFNLTDFLVKCGDTLPSEMSPLLDKMFLEYCQALSNSSRRYEFITIEAPKIQLSFPKTGASSAILAFESRPTIMKIVEGLLSKQNMNAAFEKYLMRVAASLESDVVIMRSKALKALQEIVLANPSCLKNGMIHSMIEVRLMDPSASVRDAAVELLGKIMSAQKMGQEIVNEYYSMLSSRSLDVSTNVRKRTVKILRDIFVVGCQVANEVRVSNKTVDANSLSHSTEMMVDIVIKLLSRINDEESSVKDLAFKSLQEMLFTDFFHVSRDSDIVAKSAESCCWPSLTQTAQSEVTDRSTILIEAMSSKDRSTADFFTDFLQKSIKEEDSLSSKSKSGLSVKMVCRLIIDCIVDMIVSSSSDNDQTVKVFNLMNILSLSFPSRFSPYISILRTYIKPSSDLSSPSKNERQSAEHRIAQSVISILYNTIPVATDPDTKLLNAIEQDLILHMNKGLHQIINVAVPCLCNIVIKTTKHYFIIENVHRKCLDLVKKVSSRLVFPIEAYNTALRSVLIIALLNRYFDFEKYKSDPTDASTSTSSTSSPAGKSAITQKPILSQVYELLLLFCSNRGPPFSDQLGLKMYENLRVISLSALGNVFIAHPKLLLKETSIILMNQIFVDEMGVSLKVELLKIFVDFLQNETKKMSLEAVAKDGKKEKKKIDIKVLVGNAEEMGDSGVSSSLMQFYLDYILGCLLNGADSILGSVAFEVLILVLEQGLVHPMMCMPAIVAMETSPTQSVRERAARVHVQLSEKHASIIHGKNIDCIKRSFEYQTILSKNNPEKPAILGYRYVNIKIDEDVYTRPEALLSKMYQILQSKKTRRNEFLMNMVLLLDVDLTKSEKANIPLCRYLADNLATLEYKNVEEILHVLFYCSRILSITAEACQIKIQSWSSGATASKGEVETIANASVAMGVVLLLKMHLQELYNISDSKRQAYQPSGSKSNEKQASKSNSAASVLDFKKLPFVEKSLFASEDDMWKQLKDFEALMDHYLSTTNIDPMDLDKSEAQDDGTADGASLVLPCWDDTSTAGQTSTTATPIKKVVSSTKKKLQQRRKSAPKAAKPMAVKKRRKSSLSKKYEHSDEESDEQESDDDYQCCDL